MRCLVVGGTGFLGGAIVDTLIADGHDVTILSRGQTSRSASGKADVLTADRHGDLSVLADQSFDWVFDTCAFAPDAVERLLRVVGGACSRYVFISSLSVYGMFMTAGLQETSPAQEATQADLELAAGLSSEQRALGESYGQSYGPLKRACEIKAEEMLGDKAIILRVGLLTGAGDNTDRFTWWVRRIDEAFGERAQVPAPAPEGRLVQMINVLDVAGFALHCAEDGLSGHWNVTSQPIPLSSILATAIEVTGSDAEPVRVTEQSIVDAGINAWTDIPLLVPGFPFLKHFFEVSTERAVENGLSCRTIQDTICEVLEWDRRRRTVQLSAGMTEQQEALLLG